MLKNSGINKRSSSHGHVAHVVGGAHDDEPHVTPLKIYFAVFGALLVLTVVTVLVSLLGLPPVPSLIVALLVALVKASIVALWFMHLISEERFYSFILVSTVFFMSLFFVLTLVDLSGRGATNIEETPAYWHKFSHENVDKPASSTTEKKDQPPPASEGGSH